MSRLLSASQRKSASANARPAATPHPQATRSSSCAGPTTAETRSAAGARRPSGAARAAPRGPTRANLNSGWSVKRRKPSSAAAPAQRHGQRPEVQRQEDRQREAGHAMDDERPLAPDDRAREDRCVASCHHHRVHGREPITHESARARAARLRHHAVARGPRPPFFARCCARPIGACTTQASTNIDVERGEREVASRARRASPRR